MPTLIDDTFYSVEGGKLLVHKAQYQLLHTRTAGPKDHEKAKGLAKAHMERIKNAKINND